jgi:hypothetical protein
VFKGRKSMPVVERFGKIPLDGEGVVEVRRHLLATLQVVEREPRRPPMRRIGSAGGFDHLGAP